MTGKHIYCCTCGGRKKRSELRTNTTAQFSVLQKQFFKIFETEGHFCNKCYHLYTNFCEGNIIKMTTILHKINAILFKRSRPPHTAKQLNDIRLKYQNIGKLEQCSNKVQVDLSDDMLPTKNDQNQVDASLPISTLSTSYCIIRSELLAQLCTQVNCSTCGHNILQVVGIHQKGIVTIITLFCDSCKTEMKYHTDYYDSNGSYQLNKRFAVSAHLGCLSFPALKRFTLSAGLPCIGKTYFNEIGVKHIYPIASAKTSAQMLQNRNKFFKKYFEKFKLRLCLFFYEHIPQSELQIYRQTKMKGDGIWSLQRFYSYYCEEIIVLIYSFLYPSIYISIAFDGSYPSKRNADYVRLIVRETKLTQSILWRSYKIKRRTHDNDSSKFIGPSNMLEGKALEAVLQQMIDISYCNLKLMIRAYCHDNDGKARYLIGQYFHSVPYALDKAGNVLLKKVLNFSSLNIDPDLQQYLSIPLINPFDVPFFLQEKYEIKLSAYQPNELVAANILFKNDWEIISYDMIPMREDLDIGHAVKSLDKFCSATCSPWRDKVVKGFKWALYNCKSNAEELGKLLLAFPHHWAKDHSYCSLLCSKDDSGKKRLDLSNSKDRKMYQALCDVMAVYAKRATKFVSSSGTNWNESINRSILVDCPKTMDYSKTSTNRVDLQLLRTQVGENYIHQILEAVGIDITEYDTIQIQKYSTVQEKQYEYKRSSENLKKKYLSKLAYKHLHSKANANDEKSYYHSERTRIIAEVSENARLEEAIQNIQPPQDVAQSFCICTSTCKTKRCPCRAANRQCNALCTKHKNCTNLPANGISASN